MPIVVLYSNNLGHEFKKIPTVCKNNAVFVANFVNHPVLVPKACYQRGQLVPEFWRSLFSWERMSKRNKVEETHALAIGYWLVSHNYTDISVRRNSNKLLLQYTLKE